MWWFGGERDERDEGERESSETGRRLYCCMEEALGTGRIWKSREERGGYIRGAGFVSAIASDLLGMERKWVKDRTEVMGFDFDSRGEGKGKGKGTKKSREVIKLEAVFHSGPRVRIATCQSVTLHTWFANQSLFQGQTSPVHQRPRALREFGDPPPLILPLTETAHLSIATPGSRNLAISSAARSHDPFRLLYLGAIGSPLRLSTVRSPMRPKVSPARNNR
jgi:hypothetical protein